MGVLVIVCAWWDIAPELGWERLHVTYIELVDILKLGRNPLVHILEKQLWMCYFAVREC